MPDDDVPTCPVCNTALERVTVPKRMESAVGDTGAMDAPLGRWERPRGHEWQRSISGL